MGAEHAVGVQGPRLRDRVLRPGQGEPYDRGRLGERTLLKILVLDNYDSFTFNLVQYLGELGADVIVKRNDEVSLREVESLGPQAVVISPGPGGPHDAGLSTMLVGWCASTATPLLGVCLGHQAIAEAFGGRIVPAPSLMHGKTSDVSHDGSGVFANIPNPFVAMRYHSLAVDRESLPEELEVTAWTEDGVIMGIRHRARPIQGVQFHPESILTGEGMKLLRNFLDQESPTRISTV